MSLTQRGLADLLNLKAQQIQRYEAERYATASYERLCEVAYALGIGNRIGFSGYSEEQVTGRSVGSREGGEERAVERARHAK